jgi:hypothetical protein
MTGRMAEMASGIATKRSAAGMAVTGSAESAAEMAGEKADGIAVAQKMSEAAERSSQAPAITATGQATGGCSAESR